MDADMEVRGWRVSGRRGRCGQGHGYRTSWGNNTLSTRIRATQSRTGRPGLVWSGGLVSVQLLARFSFVGNRLLMGDFWFGLAGEVLFAEVLVTPTGQSKGCGCVFSSFLLG